MTVPVGLIHLFREIEYTIFSSESFFFPFKGNLEYLPNKSLNALLHYRPLLLWVREGTCPFVEEQKQIGLSFSSWKGL